MGSVQSACCGSSQSQATPEKQPVVQQPVVQQSPVQQSVVQQKAPELPAPVTTNTSCAPLPNQLQEIQSLIPEIEELVQSVKQRMQQPTKPLSPDEIKNKVEQALAKPISKGPKAAPKPAPAKNAVLTVPFEKLTAGEREKANAGIKNGIKKFFTKPTAADIKMRTGLLAIAKASPTTSKLIGQARASGMPFVVAQTALKADGVYNDTHNILVVDTDAAKRNPKDATATLAHEAMHAIDDQVDFRHRATIALREAGLPTKFALMASETIGKSAGSMAAAELGILYKGQKPAKTMEEALNLVINSPTYQKTIGFKPSDITPKIRAAVLGVIKSLKREVKVGLLPFKSKVPAIPLMTVQKYDAHVRDTLNSIGRNQTTLRTVVGAA